MLNNILCTALLIFFYLFSFSQKKEHDSVLLKKGLRQTSRNTKVIHSGNAEKYKTYIILAASAKQLPLTFYLPIRRLDN